MNDHTHHHNGFSDCSPDEYRNCNGCHCHFQDERCTPCCIKDVTLSAREYRRLTFNEWPVKDNTVEVSEAYKLYNIKKCPPGGTYFRLIRKKDESGVSGTGLVLEGSVFGDGTTVVRWCTENAEHSTTVFGIEDGKSGWERFLEIHVQSHHNNVEIQFQRGRQQWSWQQRPDPEEARQKICERVMKTLREYLEILGEEDIYGYDRESVESVINLAYETAPDSKSLQGLLQGTPYEIEEAAQFVEKAYNKAEVVKRPRPCGHSGDYRCMFCKTERDAFS